MGSHGTLTVGDRVRHVRTGSRGTLIGWHNARLVVVEFDDGGPHNVRLDSITRLLQKHLKKTERFKRWQKVRDWRTGREGLVIETPNGDYVTIRTGFGSTGLEIIQSRNLLLVGDTDGERDE